MSRRFILDADAVSGQFSTFEYDAGEDAYVIRHGQTLDKLIDANKADYNDDKKRMTDGLGQKVASIPLHIYFELRKQGIVQDRKAFKRWLNDPDNLYFRTAPGRI